MAWTTTDLERIETAIASSEMRVKFADGREVEYRSISELLKARDTIRAVLNSAAGAVRSTLISFSRG